MATITIASRPSSLDGCFSQWSEQDAAATLRSEMDLGGFTKVRLRTTDAGLAINASVTLVASLEADFLSWFRVNCARGLWPTRVKRPDGTEIVARFTAAPQITYPERDKSNFTAACTLEQLPAWRDL